MYTVRTPYNDHSQLRDRNFIVSMHNYIVIMQSAVKS